MRHVATETTAGVLKYAEEVEGRGTRFAGRAVQADDPDAAADSLWIVRASENDF